MIELFYTIPGIDYLRPKLFFEEQFSLPMTHLQIKVLSPFYDIPYNDIDYENHFKYNNWEFNDNFINNSNNQNTIEDIDYDDSNYNYWEFDDNFINDFETETTMEDIDCDNSNYNDCKFNSNCNFTLLKRINNKLDLNIHQNDPHNLLIILTQRPPR